MILLWLAPLVLSCFQRILFSFFKEIRGKRGISTWVMLKSLCKFCSIYRAMFFYVFTWEEGLEKISNTSWSVCSGGGALAAASNAAAASVAFWHLAIWSKHPIATKRRANDLRVAIYTAALALFSCFFFNLCLAASNVNLDTLNCLVSQELSI